MYVVCSFCTFCLVLYFVFLSNETACVFMPMDSGWEKNGKSITIPCYNLQENEKNLKEKLKELTGYSVVTRCLRSTKKDHNTRGWGRYSSTCSMKNKIFTETAQHNHVSSDDGADNHFPNIPTFSLIPRCLNKGDAAPR